MQSERVISQSDPDKNGTVIQLIEYNCPKCLGAGESPKWSQTGYKCFTCKGTGFLRKKRKVYTKEYRNKLDSRNNKRKQANQEDFFGLNQEVIYLIEDEFTLKNKSKYMEAGGVYIRGLGWYFLKKPIAFKSKSIKVKDYLYLDNGQIRAIVKEKKHQR